MTTPILKWCGGKRTLAPAIAEALGPLDGKRYVEPFVGGAAVFLHLRDAGFAGHALLADYCLPLIQCYRSVRNSPASVEAFVRTLCLGGDAAHYYNVRDAFNLDPTGGGVEQAARFIWLNRTGFNGLCRFNAKGQFNVPIGDMPQVSCVLNGEIPAFSAALHDAKLFDCSFDETLRQCGAGDVVYCDPPYVPSSPTANFTTYSGQRFSLDDQTRLAVAAKVAVDRGARVVLSNLDTEWVRRTYGALGGFTFVEVEGRRSVSRSTKGRKKARELLIIGGA